jgi:hypothetical protein
MRATNLITSLSFRDGLSIRNIIGSRAVMSTVINEVNNELVNENTIISEITSSYHNLQNDALYAVMFIGSLYLQYQYFIYFDKKLKGTKMFSTVQERTKTILFIFMLVFTKNIQNAI